MHKIIGILELMYQAPMFFINGCYWVLFRNKRITFALTIENFPKKKVENKPNYREFLNKCHRL